MNERWIADLKTLEMYERQPDNSYRPAYKMTPIKHYPKDHSGEPPCPTTKN